MLLKSTVPSTEEIGEKSRKYKFCLEGIQGKIRVSSNKYI